MPVTPEKVLFRNHKEPGDEPAPPPDQDELITSGTQAAVKQRP